MMDGSPLPGSPAPRPVQPRQGLNPGGPQACSGPGWSPLDHPVLALG